MENQHGSCQETKHSSFEEKPATNLINKESSSMVRKDDGLDAESMQDSDNGKGSEVCVVQPDDVMTLQLIQADSSSGLSSNADEMLFSASGVVYEFPKDPDESSVTAAGAEFFDSPTAAGERNLTAQGSREDLGPENRRAVVGSAEVLLAGEVAARQSAIMGSDQNDSGSDRNARKRTNQVDEDRSDDPRPDEDQDEPRVTDSSSDEFVDAGVAAKRRKLNPFPNVMVGNLSDEGNLADTEDSGSSSGAEAEDRQTHVPIATGLFGPGGVFGVQKHGKPPAKSLFVPPGVDKPGNGQSDSDKLFKQPKLVKRPKHVAASGVTRDLFTIKEDVAEESSTGKAGSVLFKEAQPVQSPKHASTSKVITDLPATKTDASNVNRTEPRNTAGSFHMPAARTSPEVQQAPTSRAVSNASKNSTGISCTPASKSASEPGPSKLGSSELGFGGTSRKAPEAESTKPASCGTSREAPEPESFKIESGGTSSKAPEAESSKPEPGGTSGKAPEPGPSSAPSTSRSAKMKAKVSSGRTRCGECNARLGLTAIQCRCGKYYCAKHRYDRDHNCTFDYRALGKEEIRRNNPTVVAEKVKKL